MKKVALIIISLTVFSKILGFLREIVLSYYYGTSAVSDAYLVSLIIPGTIFAFIGAGLTTNFIPIYTEVENKEGKNSANLFINNVLSFILLLAILIIILTFFFTKQIVQLFALGFEGETLSIAIYFTRVSIIGIIFYGINYAFTGYLNVKNKFIIPVLTTLPFNITIILSIILSYYNNQNLLAYGSLLAIILQVLFMLPSMLKKGFEYRMVFNLKDQHLKKIIYLSIPVILGTSVNQINRLVDRTIASNIIIGGISALNYADRLNHFVLGIFVTSITTVVFPSFAKLYIEKKNIELKKSYIEYMIIIALILIPATVVSLIFSRQIVDLLFGRGEFDANSLQLTSSALFFYSLGLIGIGIRELTSRVFFAMHNTKTPMFNAAIGMGLNIALNIILSRLMGISGLALATSISAIFTAILMFNSLYKRIGSIGLKKFFITFCKILLAALIMGIFAKITFLQISTFSSQNISLLFSILVSVFIYATIIHFSKIKEVSELKRLLINKLSRSSK
jgi:putative peptidoglycan lipid II flippase